MSAGIPLGIRGLPAPLDRLLDGELYALSAPPSLFGALLLGLTQEALRARRKLSFVSDQPQNLAGSLAEHGVDVSRAHQRGQLRFLSLSADPAVSVRRFGPAQWLDELDHYGVERQAVLAVAPAAELFDWSNRPALAGYARLYHGWARQMGVPVLLLFEDDGITDNRALRLARAYPGLSGTALLSTAGEDVVVWETRQWLGLEAGTPRVHRLRLEAGGQLGAIADDAAVLSQWRRRVQAAPDGERVIATQGAVHGLRGWPTGWEIVPEMHGVERAAAEAVAATCLLDLSDLQQFRALARLVYRLRRQRGRGLKILVREQGLRLRQGQANLLLALGANGILTAQTGSAALAARLEQASSEIFIRPIFDDFESAFISAMPPAVAGYQAPPRFVTLARDATRRARSGGLDCALVRFFLLPNVTPLEALQQLRILRPGDLCTADEQSVYLFLFACWQEDVDRAVENILRRPVEQLFEGQIRSVAAEAVLAELADLSVRTAQQPARNLTVALAAVPLESPASETRRVAASALRPEARKSGRRVRPAPLRLIGADS